MSWLHAPNISATHGFSTRYGGVSSAPFDSLNLGGHEDKPENIKENRRIALQQLGIDTTRLANLKQVHGNSVVIACKPGAETGDALVTKEKNLALAVSMADCYPLLFHDPVHQVIGAVHAGWRGTLARIAAAALTAMEKLGADAKQVRVAIGQGICQKNFEVGEDVCLQFREAGFPEDCLSGRYLDLLRANRHVLIEKGIDPRHIWMMQRCSTETDFFSYRRDKGRTGRMWAVIVL